MRKREWVTATRTGLRNCSALKELKPTSSLALSAREELEETHDHTNKRGNYGTREKDTRKRKSPPAFTPLSFVFTKPPGVT